MQAPRHVAIIMDGNGRWARARHRPRLEGHRAGLRSIRRVLEAADELGIAIVSLYAFSTENWSRPRPEVDGLMRLFSETIDREIDELDERGIQVRVRGRREGLSKSLIRKIEAAEARTGRHQHRMVNLLINYGGRAEIVDAMRAIVSAGQRADEIDEESVRRGLYNPDLPDPELVIRTAGEQRISNFLIWETAYSEFHFTDTLWPDFDKADLEEAVAAYQARERKFGGLVGATGKGSAHGGA
jgi:undecaprenyl diphosphate synthase